MRGKSPQGRPLRPSKPHGRRPTGGGKPKPRPAPKPRGPVGDPRVVYRRDPAAFGLRQAESRAVAGEAPACAIKTRCGACKYVNLDYKASLADKFQVGLSILREAGVLDVAHILPAMESPRPLGYRAYFKLAVRPLATPPAAPTSAPAAAEPPASGWSTADAAPEAVASTPTKRFAIGLFEPGTHDVIDMDDCPLHVPPLRRLLKDLREELDASLVTPFDETTGEGQLRYLAARAAHLTGEIMLTFVVRTPLKHELRAITQRLLRRGHKINSAHMNINDGPGNAIFGAETVRLAGSDRLRERLCDLDFEVGPTSFFQINPWQAINLYRRVEMIAGPAQPGTIPAAWDLYCGTGQISLILARQGYRVLGIEENPLAVNDARANARKNRLEDRAEFVAARVEDSETRIPVWAKSPSLIVANPSRRGLAEATRSHLTWLLTQQPQSRFVYVSCNVETLARDLAELTRSGFVVRQVEAFDMFAQTDGLEWLVVLTR
jgi:23S rRNA (uracil1939-C5)-methyltransferase